MSLIGDVIQHTNKTCRMVFIILFCEIFYSLICYVKNSFLNIVYERLESVVVVFVFFRSYRVSSSLLSPNCSKASLQQAVNQYLVHILLPLADYNLTESAEEEEQPMFS